MLALEGAGFLPELASELRCYDGAGNAAEQARLITAAKGEIDRLIGQWQQERPDVWVTYHNYYKAPDLLGPAVCRALDIPYVLIEATRAHKRLTGPWADFAAKAEAASDAARAILYQTAHDEEALRKYRVNDQALVHLPPFLPIPSVPAAASPDRSARMLSVGMMRAGDKQKSYQIIAEALAHLDRDDWQLDIAGDGPVRAEIEKLMAPFGSRVRFLGQLDKTSLATAYENAALMLWPGVNEAYGMVFLEAQAAGLPLVTQDRAGVRDVAFGGPHPWPDTGPRALARRIDHLMSDPALRKREGRNCRETVERNNMLSAAQTTLRATLTPLLGASA